MTPCCPEFAPNDLCDTLDFHYRLTSWVQVENRQVPVEMKLHFRFSRCRGPLVIGDLVYTTTLLPGEKVRLTTSDRRSKFTFDTTTKFGYRNTQSSEESMLAQQFSDSVVDTNSRDKTTSSNQNHAHVDGHADAGVDVFSLGGSANMSGNFDSNSLSTFLGEHSAHAENSFHAAEMGTRKASSVSIGESQSRTHTESESQDHYESASREFENKNTCHAVTFLFYQINKTFTVKYTLEAIDLRVIMDNDPAKDFTRVAGNPQPASDALGVTSTTVLATDQRAALREAADLLTGSLKPFEVLFSAAVRQQALKQVQKDLVNEKLIDASGAVTKEAKALYSFEKQSSLPTPGIIVKGCLDDCDVCEPTLMKSIELDLENKRLQNELLKKQIELLDKSQEYRCCPGAAAA